MGVRAAWRAAQHSTRSMAHSIGGPGQRMNVIVRSSQGAELHVTLIPTAMKLGTPYEVQLDQSDSMKVRMIDHQESSTVDVYRFDLIATVARYEVNDAQ